MGIPVLVYMVCSSVESSDCDRLKIGSFVTRHRSSRFRRYALAAQANVGNNIIFDDRPCRTTGLPRSVLNSNKTLCIVLLFSRTDTAVHNAHPKRRYIPFELASSVSNSRSSRITGFTLIVGSHALSASEGRC